MYNDFNSATVQYKKERYSRGRGFTGMTCLFRFSFLDIKLYLQKTRNFRKKDDILSLLKLGLSE